MSLAFKFDLPPKEAVDFFRQKGLRTSFAWQDVWRSEHSTAFTVAKMMDVGLLKDVRDAVDKAIAEGETLATFRKRITPTLKDAGWWGEQEANDPLTGETKVVQLGSVRRLRNIFQVNMQMSYAAGDWQQIQDNANDAPYLMYDAVKDSHVRPEHKAWDGIVLPIGDPFWAAHYPPNDWGCRCGTIQLTLAEAQGLGKVPGNAGAKPLGTRPVGENDTREYVNPRTGEVMQVPRGVGPGFAYNPGVDRVSQLSKQLADKMQEWNDGK